MSRTRAELAQEGVADHHDDIQLKVTLDRELCFHVQCVQRNK